MFCSPRGDTTGLFVQADMMRAPARQRRHGPARTTESHSGPGCAIKVVKLDREEHSGKRHQLDNSNAGAPPTKREPSLWPATARALDPRIRIVLMLDEPAAGPPTRKSDLAKLRCLEGHDHLKSSSMTWILDEAGRVSCSTSAARSAIYAGVAQSSVGTPLLTNL